MSKKTVRTGIIGCGGMSHYHIRKMFRSKNTEIVALCDPSKEAINNVTDVFESFGVQTPPNEPNLNKFLETFNLDAVLIATPHAMHHDHTIAALEAELDVLLEKPMVINTKEAINLIDTRDRTGKSLVIAFQGSLSPLVRLASGHIKEKKYGNLLSVSATVWQNWGPNTAGTWRQQPALSGGGFIFDTGAHMLNTVADLVNQDFVEVAAWMDTKGRPVEILSVAIAKLE
ncbi:MAG: Gfo/Idh/MocA family oxidoreductase, partial [Chloroflexota bacterium]|nr:Gfo/Idh/MocA family oxidoreductase [Chloroflexota bacterium]